MKKSVESVTKPAKNTVKNEAVNRPQGQLIDKKSNDKKKLYKCVLCEEKFAEHSFMIEHFRKHGERKQIGTLSETKLPTKDQSSDLIKCEWCTEVFVTISKAIEHKFRKHRYESTNYFCSDCGKLFPLKVALEQHNQVEHWKPQTQRNDNDKNRSFLCKFCAVSFSTLEAVKFHENGAHQMEQRLQNIIILPPASKKVKLNNQGEVTTLYYCHLCGNEYMVKFNLMKHLDVCHTIEEKSTTPTDGMIKCRACDAIFYNTKAYNVHNFHHKPDDLYVTSEEHRQKIVNRVDQDFDISRVPAVLKPISLKRLASIPPKHSAITKKMKRNDSSQATKGIDDSVD
ncbi:hypothetical protein HA402_002571 [Bradysia odoriphaga]|nr:hypothetical protein HA402_002571 [Bradysia odoriphaga]